MRTAAAVALGVSAAAFATETSRRSPSAVTTCSVVPVILETMPTERPNMPFLTSMARPRASLSPVAGPARDEPQF